MCPGALVPENNILCILCIYIGKKLKENRSFAYIVFAGRMHRDDDNNNIILWTYFRLVFIHYLLVSNK